MPEVGKPGNMTAVVSPLSGRSPGELVYAPDPAEHTWDLQWPLNVAVYQEMRRSDGQVGSLLRAMTNPIVSANWSLDDEDVDPVVVEFVRRQLGLSETGRAMRRRRRNGVVWTAHVREALTSLAFGHAFFEQVYGYSPDDNRIHLRKLSLRPANTLTRIDVARDGGLVGIWQSAPDLVDPQGVFIPVDRLVAYVIEREGADWTGQSMLRTAYKHWLIRDQLMRIDAQSIERNRMGIPTMEYDPAVEGAREEAQRIVSELRAGESAGVVLPQGSSFSLTGVSGQLADAIPSLNWHDQAISRSALAMFLNLGHDAGARSLGDTFKQFFTDALQAVADHVGTVATEYVIRDLVELNFGPNEPYPVMTPGRLSSAQLSASDLAAVTNAGLLTPDARLEDHLRDMTGLPRHEAETARTPVAETTETPVVPESEAGRLRALAERLIALSEAKHADG